jgi:hypothetical protein
MKEQFRPSSKVIGLLKSIKRKGKVMNADLIEIYKLDE